MKEILACLEGEARAKQAKSLPGGDGRPINAQALLVRDWENDPPLPEPPASA